ncbi:MAG: hypothetical protein LBT38_05290 [Deltaproteobacteria bacterium]|jgi:hypothetical protein|nr:hypothetical protein [Deltaproteobacteria bacterium]
MNKKPTEPWETEPWETEPWPTDQDFESPEALTSADLSSYLDYFIQIVNERLQAPKPFANQAEALAKFIAKRQSAQLKKTSR